MYGLSAEKAVSKLMGEKEDPQLNLQEAISLYVFFGVSGFGKK